MKSNVVKLAAAAVVIVAVAVGLSQILGSHNERTGPMPGTNSVSGPMTIKLPDGSTIALAKNARVKLYDNKTKRGFEHIAGEVDVSVAKGSSEFVVTTPYGQVKALGTEFTMDLVDGVVANTAERVQLLAVKVNEGSVQVSNAAGSVVIQERQRLTVEKDGAPYDFAQDENLPARLRQRIRAMLDTFEAGDAKAYLANYNIDYIYKLVKGQVQYDPSLFGGSKADAERLQETFGNVASVQELSEQLLSGINITGPAKAYLRSVELNEDGTHAKAVLVVFETENRMISSTPQWHFFDNDWWQIDD